jgi:hypothetical protein
MIGKLTGTLCDKNPPCALKAVPPQVGVSEGIKLALRALRALAR